MKNINVVFLIAAIVGFSACEIDNYDGPDAQISGQIFTFETNGELLRTDQGNSTRIRMDELSWAKGDTSIAITPTFLNVKKDGTYANTKIFSGEYRMTPVDGPFYPCDEDGAIVHIKSSAPNVQNFVVIPYATIEWVKEPELIINAGDTIIEASVRFTRNAKEGVDLPGLQELCLFISSNHYVGRGSWYEDIISSRPNGGRIVTTGSSPLANREGQEITLRSTGIKYTNMTYYVRVGVSTEIRPTTFNYTTVVEIPVYENKGTGD